MTPSGSPDGGSDAAQSVSTPAEPTLPLVTIGIPTFNRVQWIGRAIESALAQTHQRVEVLVSDNQSTDGTADICRDYAERHPHVRVFRQAVNLGPTANFNALLERASGDYFMWLGDDDWIDPNYVAEMLSIMRADASVALASGSPVYYRNGRTEDRARRSAASGRSRLSRVLAYYWQVDDNGSFYGLMRNPRHAGLRLQNVMGGDWLFLAALAATGKLVTTDKARVHRELGGATASYARIARTMGLSPLQARFPFASIACWATRDILRSPVHRAAFGTARHAVAPCVFACIAAKALVLHTRNFMHRLNALRHRLASRGAQA